MGILQRYPSVCLGQALERARGALFKDNKGGIEPGGGVRGKVPVCEAVNLGSMTSCFSP